MQKITMLKRTRYSNLLDFSCKVLQAFVKLGLRCTMHQTLLLQIEASVG